jgi:hypothetical protein
MISPILIPILGICCGLLAIFGGVVVRPWFAYKNRRMELDAQMIAENPRNMRPIQTGSNSGCGYSNGSSPTAGSNWRMRSNSCETKAPPGP